MVVSASDRIENLTLTFLKKSRRRRRVRQTTLRFGAGDAEAAPYTRYDVISTQAMLPLNVCEL